MRANLTFFFLAIFLIAAVSGWEWPYIAKLMPVYVAAIPGILLCLIQLYREATAWEDRRGTQGGIEMDEIYEAKMDRQIEARRTVTFFAWFVGGAFAIWLLGIVVAIPLLVFLYMLVEGKEKWSTSLLMTVCAYLIIWGLFEYMLQARWPAGLLFQ
jgi:hypothetical protein